MPKPAKVPFEIEFDPGTIKHLGLQMYSTLPPVIGELVSNAWDADASGVNIRIPAGPFADASEIVVEDDGLGMGDSDVRSAYLVVGRDRRAVEKTDTTPAGRPIMGRKGIGKFSAFGIAGEIEVESIKRGETSRFVMRYADFESAAKSKRLEMPALPPSGTLKKGTRVTLRAIKKFRNRSVDVASIRRGLARRFSIIGASQFAVSINGADITPHERDLTRLLDKQSDGKQYLWKYKEVEIRPGSGWRVSGWIGALDRTSNLEDGIQRGIAIFARGKMVQEPFVFDAVVGQQFALSYLVGELHAEFVDGTEDTIATSRNSLVWDTEANAALKEWGRQEVNRVAREWAERRTEDNERELEQNSAYKRFVKEADAFDDTRTKKLADDLIRKAIRENPLSTAKSLEPLIEQCVTFLEFDAFRELADDMTKTDLQNIPRVIELFREWEVVEAKEMLRVTEGRIRTIEKLQRLIDKNALEVPTLHNFLKEFPWVLDPRWTLIADEVRYSQLLRNAFPEPSTVAVDDRRIDFLCVRESSSLVVVEIKRPRSKANKKTLEQIEEYVGFMRQHVKKTTDPDLRVENVVGYLLVGDMVQTGAVAERVDNLYKAQIYVRRYSDLLGMVERTHEEFLERYKRLKKAKAKPAPRV